MKKKVITTKQIFYTGNFTTSEISLYEGEKLLHTLREEIKKQDKRKIKWPWRKHGKV